MLNPRQSVFLRLSDAHVLIGKHIDWHVFRRTFSTLLAENDEGVKTVHSLMRHANSNSTMNIYAHSVSSKKLPTNRELDRDAPCDTRTLVTSERHGSSFY